MGGELTFEKMKEQIKKWKADLDAMEAALTGLIEQRNQVMQLFGQFQNSPALPIDALHRLQKPKDNPKK